MTAKLAPILMQHPTQPPTGSQRISKKVGPIHLRIKGIECERVGQPMQLVGQTFDTYQARDLDDSRLWERSRETGRIIQTR